MLPCQPRTPAGSEPSSFPSRQPPRRQSFCAGRSSIPPARSKLRSSSASWSMGRPRMPLSLLSRGATRRGGNQPTAGGLDRGCACLRTESQGTRPGTKQPGFCHLPALFRSDPDIEEGRRLVISRSGPCRPLSSEITPATGGNLTALRRRGRGRGGQAKRHWRKTFQSRCVTGPEPVAGRIVAPFESLQAATNSRKSSDGRRPPTTSS